MLLRSIYLKNIRSYKEETIFFKNGTNLLWGEVGSGKTTVLLAIEFALFGLGKDEGKLLLRNGEKIGEVILTLEKINNDYKDYDNKNNNKQFKIKRILERDKNEQVRQKQIIIEENNEIVELTPIEANNYILKRFNLPKTKGQKNLAYRYIIYTPQEELKKILEEKEEKRINIIRKAFGIEKYKNLKEVLNIIYLNEKKYEKKNLEEKIEKLSNNEEKLKKLEEEFLNEKKKLVEIEQKLKKSEENRRSVEEKEDLLQDKKNKLEKLKEKLFQEKNNLENIEKNIELKKREKENLENEKNNLLKDISKERLLKELKELNDKIGKNSRLIDEYKKLENEKESYEKRIKEIEYLNNKLEGENEVLKERTKDVDEIKLKKRLEELKIEKSKIEKFKERNKIIDKEIINSKSEKERISKEIEEKEKTIKEFKVMKICNVCQQEVPESHKQNVISKLENKIRELTEKKEKFVKKVNEFEEEKEDNLRDIEKESKLAIEIATIDEKLKDFYIVTKKIQFNFRKIDENNIQLKEINKTFDNERYNNLKEIYNKYSEDIQKFNEIKSKREKLEIFEKQLEKTKKYIENESIKLKEKENLNNKLKILHNKEKKLGENFEKLREARKKISLNIEFLSKNFGTVESNINNIRKEITKLKEEIKEGKEAKKRYNLLIDLENWIKNHLFSFLESIEVSLFRKYWAEFNEIFEDIFRELIDDNSINVYLNSNFSPSIEVNGYIDDFTALSGGERSSIALAYRISLSQVIENNLLEKIKLKFIILDEPTDGFSGKQVNKISYLLQKFNFEQTIIVSHDEKLKTTVDNIINLEKRNGVTEIL